MKLETLCGSQRGLRERMMGCQCGVVGDLFFVNGEPVTGHFCKNQKRWTLKNLPSIPVEELYELYDKIHHIGVG